MSTPVPEDAAALTSLACTVVHWQRRHGRHDLPWQGTRSAYRIWLSEIMLQQTQVTTVIPYYERFVARFPDVTALAAAGLDEVMRYWAGLGYYARARNLHACARRVVDEHQGRFPEKAAALAQLPGIGRSTAAAIAAFTHGERNPILDGNVRRVLARVFAVSGPATREPALSRLWSLAGQALEQAPDTLDMRAYTQGLMDLGALVCTRRRPDCAHCPLQAVCQARHLGLQDALPQSARRPPLPQQRCIQMIWQSGTGILLERRPESGIWGGLWSLPQLEDRNALTLALARRGLHKDAAGQLASLVHTFTHFRLHIDLWHVLLAGPRATTQPAGMRWVELDDLDEYALPSPVQRLLERNLSRLRHPAAGDGDGCSSESRRQCPGSARPYPHSS